MFRFRPATVFIYSGKQVYSLTGEDPVDLPEKEYSVLKVKPSPDGTTLEEISTTFFYGQGEGDYVSSVFGYLALEGISNLLQSTGTTLVERVLNFNRGFTPQDAQQILTIFPVIGHESEQRLIDAFTVGVSSVVGYVGMMMTPELWEADRMPFPFYFDLPDFCHNTNQPCSSLLCQDLFDYLDVIGQVVLAINDGSVGQRWMEQILNFWSIWQEIFAPNDLPNNKLQQQASQTMMKGLSGYVSEMTASLADKYRSLNDELGQATERLRCQRDEALVAYRFHKQTHLSDIQTTKEAACDSLDQKIQEFHQAVNEANCLLKETNTTVLTEELGKYREETVELIDEAKHTVIEEIVRVKDECLRSMGRKDLVLDQVRKALAEDSLVQSYVKELLRPMVEECLRSRHETDTHNIVKGEEQDKRVLRLEESLRRMGETVVQLDSSRQRSGHSQFREEIELLKTEMVGLRQNFDKVLRVRNVRV